MSCCSRKQKDQAFVASLLHGRKPHVYRVIYETDESRKKVRVLTIRHGVMEEAPRDEL
jgi:hypothetical protein